MTVPPSLPGNDDQALVAILDRLELSATPQQQRQLIRYVDVLQQWNAVHNLTSVRERAEMVVQHVADCLAIVRPLHRAMAEMALAGRRAQVLDVGSGGGLPGLMIATLLPGIDVTCLDSVGKKMAFVRQAALEMQLSNAVAVHARVESFRANGFDVITSRAYATLKRFTTSTAHLLRTDGVWLAMKGRRPDDELSTLPPDNTVFHVEQLCVPNLAAERCLVWIRRR